MHGLVSSLRGIRTFREARCLFSLVYTYLRSDLAQELNIRTSFSEFAVNGFFTYRRRLLCSCGKEQQQLFCPSTSDRKQLHVQRLACWPGETMQRPIKDSERALFSSLLTPELLEVVKAFEQDNFEIRIVGGAVRDLLLGKESPKDIDLSTNATPEEIIQTLSRNGIKYIETGLQHGTVTAHLNDSDFEITTLRIDVETDGRHAKVKFTNDWRLDAERRDLTFNALSLTVTGTIYDYFGGIKDLEDKLVRFVGDPKSRIAEDYLRILRYFRFYGRIAETEEVHDEETLNIIKMMASGLKGVAVERVWLEFSRILTGRHAPHLLSLMYELGVADAIGLPKISPERLKYFGNIWQRMSDYGPQPVTLLVALVETIDDAEKLMKYWKLSNAERLLGKFVASNRNFNEETSLKVYQDILVSVSNAKQLEIVRSHVTELLHYSGKHDFADCISKWQVPSFPISGSDLKALGVRQGPNLGKVLKKLKTVWIDSYYTLNQEELLKEAEKMIQSCSS